MHYSHDTGEYDERRLIGLIRVRAYEIFERRGGEAGYALDDWLRAEREVKHHLGFESLSRDSFPDSKVTSRRMLSGDISLLFNGPN